jgi:phage shock protein A
VTGVVHPIQEVRQTSDLQILAAAEVQIFKGETTMSIFKKIRLVALGNMEDLLDKVIDTNSPAVVKQYCRDLETALNQLRNEAAVAAGQVRTLEREKAEAEGQKAHVEETIAHVLQSSDPNKDAVARQQAQLLPAIARKLSTLNDTLTTQLETSKNLDRAVQALDLKHAAMVSRIQELEMLDRGSKAKESAARALNAAGSLAAGGTDISIDNLESRIRARGDVADSKFERAMGTVSDLADPSEAAEADGYLEQIKAKLQQPA